MAVSLAIIIILGLVADYLFRRIKLPGLVGMLIVGILIGPYVLGLMRPEMMTVSALLTGKSLRKKKNGLRYPMPLFSVNPQTSKFLPFSFAIGKKEAVTGPAPEEQ